MNSNRIKILRVEKWIKVDFYDHFYIDNKNLQ